MELSFSVMNVQLAALMKMNGALFVSNRRDILDLSFLCLRY